MASTKAVWVSLLLVKGSSYLRDLHIPSDSRSLATTHTNLRVGVTARKLEGLILLEIFYLGSFSIEMYVSIGTFKGAMAEGDLNKGLLYFMVYFPIP